MTIAAMVRGWQRGAASSWPPYKAQLPEALELARRGPAHDAILMLATGPATAAALAIPDEVAQVAAMIAPVVDQASAEAQAESPADEAMTIAALQIMNLGNVVECTGATLAGATHMAFASWLPRIAVKRDAPKPLWFWLVAFASLALGDRAIYRRFTGVDRDSPLPFVAGTSVGFNLQGLVAHFAGAMETAAAIDDVMPAFEEVVGNFDALDESRSVNKDVLLWIARIVYHRIGGAPVGEVAARLHGRLAEMAAA